MSDKDSDHMLLELQEARAEVDRLRNSTKWRDFCEEKPPVPGGYMVADVSDPKEKNWWSDFWNGTTWQVEGDGVWTHWRPIGPLPGGE